MVRFVVGGLRSFLPLVVVVAAAVLVVQPLPANAFSLSSSHQLSSSSQQKRLRLRQQPSSSVVTVPPSWSTSTSTSTQLHIFGKEDSEETTTSSSSSSSTTTTTATTTKANGFMKDQTTELIVLGEEEEDAVEETETGSEGDWVGISKEVELVLLGAWGVGISAFILMNNFVGPWPEVMKTVPERMYFLSHMIGGMLFGGGIILTTCIERLVAKSNNPPVLQFWFDKVPVLDGLIVVPALTVSMVSGTGLSIVRYGGLNVAPPHVDAIFWTLIAFMSWWAATDLTTQGTALSAVNKMHAQFVEDGGKTKLETPKVVVDRHFSNVVSCFFVLLLYSFMVTKPGTLYPWPWNA
eukprot:CAMPEP_0113485976 /NCGR_PEP_ID=MMETSP0014_2-20120614/24758_1 /TAXON_ID=2857 /ORGANISM="Nitzschia sp." /LENGTH=350 /DNA_ID=CAMNT_0000379633 /DNA_START=80 /DNA_END=1132 /DNA_ORIENTATION=- /assembly_acc=CAM_ASM_000159